MQGWNQENLCRQVTVFIKHLGSYLGRWGGCGLGQRYSRASSGDQGRRMSELISLNGSLDPLAISADVGIDSWLLFGPAGDVTP